jgi:hypothetical protein
VECSICERTVKYKNLKEHNKRDVCEKRAYLKKNLNDMDFTESWKKLRERIDINDVEIKHFNINYMYDVVPIYEDIVKSKDYTNKYFCVNRTTPDIVRLSFDKEDNDKISLYLVDKHKKLVLVKI